MICLHKFCTTLNPLIALSGLIFVQYFLVFSYLKVVHLHKVHLGVLFFFLPPFFNWDFGLSTLNASSTLDILTISNVYLASGKYKTYAFLLINTIHILVIIIIILWMSTSILWKWGANYGWLDWINLKDLFVCGLCTNVW